MRITRVIVATWRNLRDVDLQVDSAAPLVCLVGENGSGKSAVLELLSAAAHQLGIAQGVEMARGNPFEEDHEVEVVVQVPMDDLTLPESLMARIEQSGQAWNGELRLTSQRTSAGSDGPTVTAVGISESIAHEVARTVVDQLRQRQETQHLYLDADRAYPPVQIEPYRYSEILQQQWESPEFTRQWAYRPTRTLYEEWMKYFLGVEQRCATDHVAAIRRARDANTPEPAFTDPFDNYRTTVHEVLPHLRFVGIQSSGQQRTPLFDSAGLELPFFRLSGGEREIAFLIGQIERFRLRRGLLLIDEPELHLNPDLLRNWLAFLRDTVKAGQVWIATHSLEAVEVAGPDSTFVFERDQESRTVTAPALLTGRPVLSALSAAVGSPAFAINRLRFIYVEGDRQSRERERFHTVCGDSDRNRFLEGGSCGEVLRRLHDVTALAVATDEQLHVGGVIDRDFRTEEERSQLQSELGVHVLGCHEIENIYLQPDAISVLLDRAARDPGEATTIIRESSDKFAGLWVAQHAASAFSKEHDLPKQAKAPLGEANRSQLDAEWDRRREQSIGELPTKHRDQWGALLDAAWQTYRSDSGASDWYRRCLGKQTLGQLAIALDFRSTDALERQIVSLWNAREIDLPTDLVELRTYVGGLGAPP